MGQTLILHLGMSKRYPQYLYQDQCGGSHPKQDCTKKKQKRKLQESRSTDAASATEMTASFGNKSVQEENDKKRAKKQKMKKDKSQQLSSLEPDGSRKTRATSGKLSNSVVNGIPHAISAEKIVRSTLKKVGGSCTTKKMREILRSKLGMKKVKGILAEVGIEELAIYYFSPSTKLCIK